MRGAPRRTVELDAAAEHGGGMNRVTDTWYSCAADDCSVIHRVPTGMCASHRTPGIAYQLVVDQLRSELRSAYPTYVQIEGRATDVVLETGRPSLMAHSMGWTTDEVAA